MHPGRSSPIAEHIQAPRSEAISLSGVRNRPFLRARNWGWQALRNRLRALPTDCNRQSARYLRSVNLPFKGDSNMLREPAIKTATTT